MVHIPLCMCDPDGLNADLHRDWYLLLDRQIQFIEEIFYLIRIVWQIMYECSVFVGLHPNTETCRWAHLRWADQTYLDAYSHNINQYWSCLYTITHDQDTFIFECIEIFICRIELFVAQKQKLFGLLAIQSPYKRGRIEDALRKNWKLHG